MLKNKPGTDQSFSVRHTQRRRRTIQEASRSLEPDDSPRHARPNLFLIGTEAARNLSLAIRTSTSASPLAVRGTPSNKRVEADR
jgi:hypothetical protein